MLSAWQDWREQTTSPTFHTVVKNVKILKFGDYIWNHHEKRIQISTNTPSIGLVIHEISFEFQEF